MEVSDKATATLTEMKNKIGEVLSLADEVGEVILTSYNKPKYKLVRLRNYREEDATAEVQTSAPPASDQASPITPVETKPAEVVTIQPPQIETKPKMSPVVTDDQQADWNRRSNLEKRWVQQILNAY